MRACILILSSLIALLLVACFPAAAPATTAPAAPNTAPHGTTHIQVALGFVPSVQSAPYYAAQDKGYYAAEGLDVDLKYGSIQNLLKQVSDGSIEFASVSGDSLMPQKQQGVDVIYVMTFWTKNPIGALGIAGNNNPPLKSPADLKGKNLGISAPNSSTHFALKALLQMANLNEDDVKVTAIGTTEVEALIQKRIDAAMTFLPNEAAQMKSLGYGVDTIAVYDYLKLVPPGVATGSKTMNERADMVQRFVRATLRGLKDTLDNPDAAFASSLKRMPELTPETQPLQRDVLRATLDYYKPVQGRTLGATEPDAWPATQDFLKSIGVVNQSLDPSQYYTNKFVDAAR